MSFQGNLAQDKESKTEEKGEEKEDEKEHNQEESEEGREGRAGWRRQSRPPRREGKKREADAGAAFMAEAASRFVPLEGAGLQYNNARTKYQTHVGAVRAMSLAGQSPPCTLVNLTEPHRVWGIYS